MTKGKYEGSNTQLKNPKAGTAHMTVSQARDLKQKMYERWRTNKPLFLRQVLGYDTLEPFQVKMVKHRGARRMGRHLSLRLLPRDSGKSWAGTIGDTVHEVCQNPNIKLEIIGEAVDTSILFLGEAKAHFEMNEDLRHFYGNHVSKDSSWSAKKIVSAQRTKIMKEPTVEALGATGAIVGRHVDGQYLDDVATEKTADTPAKQEKMVRWYYKTCLPVLQIGGWQKINGTRYFPEDLYATLVEQFGEEILYKVPALSEYIGKDGSIKYRSYFPNRYPVKFLLEIKKANPVAFAYQYMNDDSMGISNILDANAIRIISYKDWPDFADLTFYIGVDPATGTEAKHDFFATCTIGFNPRLAKIYVFRSTRYKLGDPDSMLNHVVDEWRWIIENGGDCAGIGIEGNAFQSVLVKAFNADCERFGILPIIQMNTNKDKVQRLIALAYYFNKGNVLFDEDIPDLVTNLLKFPNIARDDDVDSLMLAMELLEDSAYGGMSLPMNPLEMANSNAAIFKF